MNNNTELEKLEPVFRIGNLNGCYGYSKNVYGVGFGRNSVIILGKFKTRLIQWILEKGVWA